MIQNLPDLKAGGRWKATLVGYVAESIDKRVRLNVGDETTGDHFVSIDPYFCTWERLPDPAPEYVIGAYYMDAEGDVVKRTPSGWLFGYEKWDDETPDRPLTRLVKES